MYFLNGRGLGPDVKVKLVRKSDYDSISRDDVEAGQYRCDGRGGYESECYIVRHPQGLVINGKWFAPGSVIVGKEW